MALRRDPDSESHTHTCRCRDKTASDCSLFAEQINFYIRTRAAALRTDVVVAASTGRMSYLSCRPALHSKIINKRRLMLKTNDVRISDCSLLLHASLKCVCRGAPHTLTPAPAPSPAPCSSMAAISFYPTCIAQGASSSCGSSICIWDTSVKWAELKEDDGAGLVARGHSPRLLCVWTGGGSCSSLFSHVSLNRAPQRALRRRNPTKLKSDSAAKKVTSNVGQMIKWLSLIERV